MRRHPLAVEFIKNCMSTFTVPGDVVELIEMFCTS